ncbi:hypothetical protein B0H16DRAFT_265878 [Mycena metata]|uniref:Uncharacterized protein n=1 Tax=Mycena metata TaxID=1033252 RepID=A0AAD7HSQ3_9AGAR|nr:hypothetical protein B0H16DRAFT_265878 [Mycena metata]
MNIILLCLLAAFIFLMIPCTIYFLFILPLLSSPSQSLPIHGHGHPPHTPQWRPLYPWVSPILDFTHRAAYNVLTYTRIPPTVLQPIFGRFFAHGHNHSSYPEAGGGLYELPVSRGVGIRGRDGFPAVPLGDRPPNMQPMGSPHNLPSPPQAAHTAS